MKPLLLFCLLVCQLAPAQNPAKQILAALGSGDLDAVQQIAQSERARLGDQAGIPEVDDTYQTIPAGATWLDPALAKRGFAPHLNRLRQLTSAWNRASTPRA